MERGRRIKKGIWKREHHEMGKRGNAKSEKVKRKGVGRERAQGDGVKPGNPNRREVGKWEIGRETR